MTAIPRHDLFSEEAHRKELVTLFPSSWLFVGHESEVPDPGCFVTRKLANEPVVLARGGDGELHVWLNACAHRGTQLCRADAGQANWFRCMYHGWTYDSEGVLRAVPGMKKWYPAEFDRTEHGLRRARVASRSGLVFATWDDGAPPLDDYLGEFTFYLDALFARSSQGWEIVGPPLRWISHTNWKVSVENFGMDSMHLSILHESAAKLGIFGADAPASLTAYTAVCAGGHGIEATKFETPSGEATFPGYPHELWSDFREHLQPAQSWFVANNLVCKGNVFPNLSVIDLFHDYTGDPEAPSPLAATMLRLAQPTSSGTSEIWMWILVPAQAPEAWKRQSQESLVRTLGVAGTFEPDDLENVASITAANGGTVAREQEMLLVAGEHFQPNPEPCGYRLPGAVYAADMNTELMQRGFFNELDRRLGR